MLELATGRVSFQMLHRLLPSRAESEGASQSRWSFRGAGQMEYWVKK